MLLCLIKTLILSKIETDNLQGQVQSSPLMNNLSSLHSSSSIKISTGPNINLKLLCSYLV